MHQMTNYFGNISLAVVTSSESLYLGTETTED